MPVNHSAKQWACSRCGKKGNHGRRKVGLTTFYRQPQCVGCRSRYKNPAVMPETHIKTTLAELREIYSVHYPRDTTWQKRAWKFMTDKLARKGFTVDRVLTGG